MKELLRHIYRFLHPGFQTVHLDYKVDAKPRYTEDRPHQGLQTILDQQKDTYQEVLHQALSYQAYFKALQSNLSATSFTWRNDYFPAWDSVMLHTMIGRYQPSHYLEVGSGYSTYIARQAIKDHDLDTILTSIDPQPRADIEQQVDEVFRYPLEAMDLDVS